MICVNIKHQHLFIEYIIKLVVHVFINIIKKITKKKINTRSTFDFIQPYNKYNYMNNCLMSNGPRLWNELNIDKRKLVSIYIFSYNILNYFLTL